MRSLETILTAGAVIDSRYELVEPIGAGGFSQVFKALDMKSGGFVALKVLDIMGMADDRRYPEFVQRFEREARLIAKLQHPNIIRILAAGVHGELRLPYMAIELLAGMDARHFNELRQGFEAARMIPLFIGVLDALGFAHSKGIVHKDLTPANLFWRYPDTQRESLCVLDFGIAYWRSAAERLTKKNTFMGTPRYIPPEYAKDQTVSPALDVYQMGLVLIELLWGRPVINAPHKFAALLSHSRGKFELPAALEGTDLWDVLRLAIAQDATQRFSDCAAFSRALSSVDAASVPSVRGMTETVTMITR